MHLKAIWQQTQRSFKKMNRLSMCVLELPHEIVHWDQAQKSDQK